MMHTSKRSRTKSSRSNSRPSIEMADCWYGSETRARLQHQGQNCQRQRTSQRRIAPGSHQRHILSHESISQLLRQPPQAASSTVGGSPSADERRQLTVMFCDLADSTALVRQLDPEDYREVRGTARPDCGATRN